MEWTRVVVLLTVSTAFSLAQDPMWVANRTSRDLHRISNCGTVVASVDLSANVFTLRRVVQAPDGKLWIINFITPTFTVLDQNGGNLQNFPTTTGNPYDVAFDRFGHAWMTMSNTSSTVVVEYDANATPVMTYPLPFTAPLGVTVDADGNKWIAHRTIPGSLSRIDALTGAVTNYPMPAGTSIQPTAVFADFRGVGTSSHIWVIGDATGVATGFNLNEFDSTGTWIAGYTVGAANGAISSMAGDTLGNLWIGNFSNGTIYRFDTTTGTVASTFISSPTCLGLAFDTVGRLWSTARVSISGVIPSQVKRHDPVTNTFEVAANVGIGTQHSMSTGYNYAMVVDQYGDADGDGIINSSEVLAGTSPYDPLSNGVSLVRITGPSSIGSVITLDVLAAPTTATVLAIALGRVPPGSGLTVPGFLGEFVLDLSTVFLDPATFQPILLNFVGITSLPIGIPMDTNLIGNVFQLQGVAAEPGAPQFTSVVCLKIY